MRRSYVYIMTNQANQVLYTGVTSNLAQRVWQHKEEACEGFTKKYQVHKLVYCEEFSDIREAIEREKQIKKGSRQRKLDLINAENPEWDDLYEDL
jgi:putative endonuclease